VSNLSNVERGNLLEKAAEIGKDVWNAGTKLGNLFKLSSKPSKESGDCQSLLRHAKQQRAFKMINLNLLLAPQEQT